MRLQFDFLTVDPEVTYCVRHREGVEGKVVELGSLLLLSIIAYLAATLAAVTGFGSAVVVLPIAALVFGIKDAVPIITIAQLLGNGGRVWTNRREISFRLVGWFALGAVPVAFLSSQYFTAAPLSSLTSILGVFLVSMALVWHYRSASVPKLTPAGFAVLGGITALVSSLVGSSGPLVAPFFVASGLVKGAYVGTEALAAVITHATKLFGYGLSSGLLNTDNFERGCGLGVVMIAGAYSGKRVMELVPPQTFIVLIKAVLVVSGILFIVRGQ